MAAWSSPLLSSSKFIYEPLIDIPIPSYPLLSFSLTTHPRQGPKAPYPTGGTVSSLFHPYPCDPSIHSTPPRLKWRDGADGFLLEAAQILF
eukprot:749955-Hanusia_phi.AAC.2